MRRCTPRASPTGGRYGIKCEEAGGAQLPCCASSRSSTRARARACYASMATPDMRSMPRDECWLRKWPYTHKHKHTHKFSLSRARARASSLSLSIALSIALSRMTCVCVCVCVCVFVQEMAESIRHRTHISSINDQGRALPYSCDFCSVHFRSSMRLTVLPPVVDACVAFAGATLTAPWRPLCAWHR
jgi:hypothetical protein